MKARPLGPLITSGLALFALLLAALQMMVIFHSGRPDGQAALRASRGSVVAPLPPDADGPDAAPRGPATHPQVKPPRDPHPPSRSFRPNSFGPQRSRRIAV